MIRNNNSKIVQGFNITNYIYNNIHNFLDITIPRKELTKWLKVNHEILHLTTYYFTGDDNVRIWIYDEGKILRDYDIKEKNNFLLKYKLFKEHYLSIDEVFNKINPKLKEIIGYGSSSYELSLEMEAIKCSLYTNKENALLFFENVKQIYSNHYIGIESTKKGNYDIYISNNKEIEKLKIVTGVKLKKQDKKVSGKKLEITIEEIAKKFNVDIKNLKIKE